MSRFVPSWITSTRLSSLSRRRKSTSTCSSLALVDEGSLWASLGKTEEARQRYWRGGLHTPLTDKELAAVRRSVTSGRPFGPAAWVEQTAARLGLNLAPRPRGRPRKTAEK